MRILLAVALLLAATAARADVRLAKIFTDDMMVQRDRPVRVWGWAEPGEAVRVSLAGKEGSATAAADGSWLVELPALATGENLEIVVAGKNTITLKNVIVGDVWLCSGQSNMEWTMAQSDAAEDAQAADFPRIRRIKFNHVQSAKPEADAPAATPWQVCSPQTAPGFTAVGFYFARDVLAQANVPVGLLDDNWGGSKIEPWLPPGGMQAALAERVAERFDVPAERAAEIVKAMSADLAEFGIDPAKATGGWSGMYNAMVHPLARFPVKGFLWYQGESNGGEGESYFLKMRALVGGWRQVWGDPKLPFYFVQLASFQNPTEDPAGGDGWAKVREAQRKSLTIPHTGMAVILDTVPLAAAGDIHPRNKLDVGTRLARWALVRDYGKSEIVPSGPLFKALAIDGAKARVTFDHVGGGLMVGAKEGKAPAVAVAGGTLKRFAIAGADRTWHWADAVIDGDAVVVSSPSVPQPVAVRYAFSMNPAGANLYNKAGLPAAPFRTDDW